MSYHVAPIGYSRDYLDFDGETRTASLTDDVVALILDWDDGDILEWMRADANTGYASTIAHAGVAVIREDAAREPSPAVAALMRECELYADCFGVELPDLPPSTSPVPALF